MLDELINVNFTFILLNVKLTFFNENTKENAKIFINLCIKMREDIIQKRSKAEIQELENILVGMQPFHEHNQ